MAARTVSRVGGLQVVEWTGTGWRRVQAQVTANEDGGFTLTAESSNLTIFGVLYAPGASKITGFAGFGNGDTGLGLFTGGTTDTLALAAERHGAHGVWVQRNDGAFRLLSLTGPVFLRALFDDEFGGELPAGKGLVLKRWLTE